MTKFENDWTITHDAMKANIEQKEKLIDRLIGENMALVEACKAAFGISCERAQTRRKWTVKDQLIHDQLKAALTI